MGKVSKYIWIWDYKDNNYPMQFFIGARGDGKTYGALDGARLNYLDSGNKFIFSRLTIKEQKQITAKSTSAKGNPFKKINKIAILGNGDDLISSITEFEISEKNKLVQTGKEYGYACSLVDICDVRGMDFDDVTDWIIDDFIPEKHKRLPKGLGDALLNGYETINRDREDDGREALRVWGLANANDIYNPIFKELGLVSVCEKAIREGRSDVYLKDRGIAIHLLGDSKELVECRKKRAITKISKGTQFSEMAFENEFAYNDFSCVRKMALKGFRPFVELTYKRKKIYIYGREDGVFYMCHSHGKGCVSYNLDTEMGQSAFFLDWGVRLMDAARYGRMFFEKYTYYDLIVNYKKRFSLK